VPRSNAKTYGAEDPRGKHTIRGEGQRLKMKIRSPSLRHLIAAIVVCSLAGTAQASLGDRLPEFRECVKVSPSSSRDPFKKGARTHPRRRFARKPIARMTQLQFVCKAFSTSNEQIL